MIEKRTIVDEDAAWSENPMDDLKEFNDVVSAVDEEAAANAVPTGLLRLISVDLDEISSNHAHLALRWILESTHVRESTTLQRIISLHVVNELMTEWIEFKLIVHQAAIEYEVGSNQHEH